MEKKLTTERKGNISDIFEKCENIVSRSAGEFLASIDKSKLGILGDEHLFQVQSLPNIKKRRNIMKKIYNKLFKKKIKILESQVSVFKKDKQRYMDWYDKAKETIEENEKKIRRYAIIENIQKKIDTYKHLKAEIEYTLDSVKRLDCVNESWDLIHRDGDYTGEGIITTKGAHYGPGVWCIKYNRKEYDSCLEKDKKTYEYEITLMLKQADYCEYFNIDECPYSYNTEDLFNSRYMEIYCADGLLVEGKETEKEDYIALLESCKSELTFEISRLGLEAREYLWEKGEKEDTSGVEQKSPKEHCTFLINDNEPKTQLNYYK